MAMNDHLIVDFANARINPTFRTIQYWHDKWRINIVITNDISNNSC